MGGKLMLLWRLSLLTLPYCFSLGKMSVPNVFCKYDQAAQFRPSNGQFSINDIKGSLCTHVTYCTPTSAVSVNLARDATQISAFQNKYANVQILLGIQYSLDASVTTTVQAIQNAVNQLKTYNFNGLEIEITSDIDDIDSEDGNNVFAILQQIRGELNEQYLLNINLTPKLSVALRENLQAFSTVTDYMVVAGYGYNNYLQRETGLYAPLYTTTEDSVDNALQSVSGTIQLYLNNGISPDRVVIEIPSLANSFTLENPAINGIGAPTTGPGAAGPFTNTPGFLGYNELCVMLQNPGWTIRSYQQACYAFSANLWVSYDSPKFSRATVQYACQQGITSAAISDISLDDSRGQCDGGAFPLTQAINKGLGRSTNLIEAGKNGLFLGVQTVAEGAAKIATNIENTFTTF